MPAIRHAVGENIRQFRIRQKLTQAQLAARLSVTRQTITSYENEKSKPDIDMLLCLADALNVDVSQLLYGSSNEPVFSRNKHILIKASAVLLTLFLCLLFLWQGSYYLRSHFYIYSVVVFIRLAIIPLGMFFCGWYGVHALKEFFEWCAPPLRCLKSGYFFVLAVLFLHIIAVLPYIVFCLFCMFFELMQIPQIDLTFPPIPIYQSIAFFFMNIQYNFVVIYIFIGAIVQALRPPRKSSNTNPIVKERGEQNEENY